MSHCEALSQLSFSVFKTAYHFSSNNGNKDLRLLHSGTLFPTKFAKLPKINGERSTAFFFIFAAH